LSQREYFQNKSQTQQINNKAKTTNASVSNATLLFFLAHHLLLPYHLLSILHPPPLYKLSFFSPFPSLELFPNNIL
jgi:hypothetical protein